MNIIAVDPGTRNTGVVYLSERGVECVKTLTYRSTIGQDQTALMKRAQNICDQLIDWSIDKPHDLFVVEGYTSYGGARQSSTTYQTPYLCGYIVRGLFDEGESVEVQTAAEVLNDHIRGSLSWVRDYLKQGREPFPGGLECSNDHLRSALCHGLYYMKLQGLWMTTRKERR